MTFNSNHCMLSPQDYKDHIAELANKLVAIMDSMLGNSLSKVSGPVLVVVS